VDLQSPFPSTLLSTAALGLRSLYQCTHLLL